jgi:hypothetical protein
MINQFAGDGGLQSLFIRVVYWIPPRLEDQEIDTISCE